jgi:hypothetical protein
MTGVRLQLERLLRATGTFRIAKRTILRLETIGFQAATVSRQLVHGGSWPHCRRGNLVMFHTSRSGSSVIADLLTQHPDFHWDGELFNHHLQLWRSVPRQRLGEAQKLIRRRMNRHDVPYYGFEVLPSQLKAGHADLNDFAGTLDEFGFEYFVLLTRRNLLRKLISSLVARERGRWRMSSGEIAPLTRVHVDVDDLELASSKPLLDHLHDAQAEYDTLQTMLSSRRCLQLVYEDDVLRDPRRAVRRICDFLGVEYMDLPVRHGRTTPQALDQVVQNFAELERVLSGTEFEWMLRDEAGSVSP